MPELILIVIIATFIAGLSFCDREETSTSQLYTDFPPMYGRYMMTFNDGKIMYRSIPDSEFYKVIGS